MFAIERPQDVDAQVWDDFITLRKAKKAPVTATAMRGFEREAQKAGITLERAIEVACQMGWQGFRADWYAKQPAASFSRGDEDRKRDRFNKFVGRPAPLFNTTVNEVIES
jgi:hypothetical protein